jgi:hypothetical protein
MRCSPCSQVATPSPSQLGVRCGSNGPPQAATPTGGHSGIVAKGIDGHGDSTYLFQPRGPTSSSTRSEHVDAYGAKLF